MNRVGNTYFLHLLPKFLSLSLKFTSRRACFFKKYRFFYCFFIVFYCLLLSDTLVFVKKEHTHIQIFFKICFVCFEKFEIVCFGGSVTY